jgi:hypothetical protein
MDICYECCVLSGKRSLRRDDHSSRGVLLSVVCLRRDYTRLLYTLLATSASSTLVRHWTFRDELKNFSVLSHGTDWPVSYTEQVHKLGSVTYTEQVHTLGSILTSEWRVKLTDFSCTLSDLVTSEFKS